MLVFFANRKYVSLRNNHWWRGSGRSSIWCERLRRSERDGAVFTNGELARKVPEREPLLDPPAIILRFPTLTVLAAFIGQQQNTCVRRKATDTVHIYFIC